ncbi:Ribosome maturation protein SBDS [Rhodotorula toruloides]|nr:Ribosome maturation protein SBDS [Rhodotorula toruloides]
MHSFHKVVYKPDSQSTDEWIVVVGDLAVVDSFDVFHTGQGSQGVLSRASKQELENIFSTTNEDEIVQIVLEKGRIVSSNTPHQWAGTNDQRSGSYQTAHGANAGKSGHGGR